jgi:hypothetical protein
MSDAEDKALFDSRPERVEQCSRCRGAGSYVDPYALLPGSRHELGLARHAGMVIATPAGASDIFECCREAAEIAERAKRPVAFQFNAQVVVVKPGDNPNLVARAWWQAVYGETPEATMEKR